MNSRYSRARSFQEFYPHPKYRTSQSYNDIALIELERSVINEPNVSPICLFSSTKDLEESVTLTAEGYGIVDVDRKAFNKARKINLNQNDSPFPVPQVNSDRST